MDAFTNLNIYGTETLVVIKKVGKFTSSCRGRGTAALGERRGSRIGCR